MKKTCLSVILILFGCGATRAAENAIGFTLGLRTGGELTRTDADGQTRSLDSSASFGLVFDRSLGPETAITAFWSHQHSDVSADGAFVDDDNFGLDVDYLQVGGVYRPQPKGSARPFVMVSAGATWYRPDHSGFGDEIGFSMTVGGGADFRLSERLAFRLEGRGYATFTSASFAGQCISGNCTFAVSGSGGFQFEALTGLLVSF